MVSACNAWVPRIRTANDARRQQIASLDQVQWAVLETSRAISFIKKPS
jgi:uncharacterized membrane protein YcaP (DUF421 family)